MLSTDLPALENSRERFYKMATRNTKVVINPRSLYAPPLLGLLFLLNIQVPVCTQLEYTISTQEGTRGANLPPQTQKARTDSEESEILDIRLNLIGLKKAMRQIDAERAHNVGGDEDDESGNHPYGGKCAWRTFKETKWGS